MKRYCMPTLLIFSLALNVAVIATVGANQFSRWHGDAEARGHSMLVDYLKLDAEQRPRWEAEEQRFMKELGEAWLEIRERRERMITEIFSQSPDLMAIEDERAAISRLQEQQQQRVIEQLMAERTILEPEQRRRLADLLLEQNPAGSMEEFLAHDIQRP